MLKAGVKVPKGACAHCGREDVPVCGRCHQLVPHGYTVGWQKTRGGTWLPCPCEPKPEKSARGRKGR